MKFFRVSLLLLLFPLHLVGQTSTETQGSTLLPDINPQDIEIKGDYRIRFPGLQRQPILGFDPRQRVFQLDPLRMPFLETSDEIVATIPISPLEIPKSPVRSYNSKLAQNNLWILGGYGLHQVPEAELGFSTVKASDYRFSTFFKHLSSPDMGLSLPSKFANWSGNLRYTSIVEPGASWTFYTDGSLRENQVPLSDSIASPSTLLAFQSGLEFKGVVNKWDYWNFKLNYQFNQHGIDSIATGQVQQIGQVYWDNSWVLSEPRTSLALGLDAVGSIYDLDQKSSNYAIAKLFVNYTDHSSTDLKYSLGIDPYFSKDSVSTNFLVYPNAILEWYGFLGATLRAGIYGEVSNGNRNGYYSMSRFLHTDQLLLNNKGVVMYANYEVELMKRSTIYAGFDLKRYTQLGYLNYQADQSIAGRFNHAINYDEAQIVKLKGGYSYRFTAPELSFNAEAWILNHQLKNGTQIPYLERVGAKTSLLWFIQKEWYIQPEVEFLAGREGINTSSSILLVHFKTRYALNKNWAVYAKAENLTGSTYTYWSGLEERPLFITGGINLIF